MARVYIKCLVDGNTNLSIDDLISIKKACDTLILQKQEDIYLNNIVKHIKTVGYYCDFPNNTNLDKLLKRDFRIHKYTLPFYVDVIQTDNNEVLIVNFNKTQLPWFYKLDNSIDLTSYTIDELKEEDITEYKSWDTPTMGKVKLYRDVFFIPETSEKEYFSVINEDGNIDNYETLGEKTYKNGEIIDVIKDKFLVIK